MYQKIYIEPKKSNLIKSLSILCTDMFKHIYMQQIHHLSI
jgi:hypothetical protein